MFIPRDSVKKRRDTVLICFPTSRRGGRIQVNKVSRNNLRVKLGELISVHPCLDIKRQAPPRFVRGGIRIVGFKDIKTNPSDSALPPKISTSKLRKEKESNLADVGYDDNGGGDGGGAGDRVLNQIATEMDGMNAKKERLHRRHDEQAPPDRLGALASGTSRPTDLHPAPRRAVTVIHPQGSTHGFSGANLTEICQHAAKLAIHKIIDADIRRVREQKKDEAAGKDNMAVGRPRPGNYPEAMKFARRSVTDQYIRCYEMFSQNQIQARGFGNNFKFTEGEAGSTTARTRPVHGRHG
ncbi:hypothetical protein C8R43DRAFT_1142627 [Mycena crocata]|nr:hypothetical protein C8R43DRAFT_1142627 [Mycena crocata]